MKPWMVLALVAGLAGCGADGPPLRPELETAVRIGADGITGDAGLTLRGRGVTIGIGL